MQDDTKKQSWWHTLPGILTATAGVITALAGLIMALYQAGVLQHDKPTSQASSQSGNSSAASSATLATTTSGSSPTPGAAVASDVPTAPNSPNADTPKTPDLPSTASTSASSATKPLSTKLISLLSPEKSGHLVAASSDDWLGTIDGKEDFNQVSYGVGAEAVYAFKDESPATLEMFTMFIPGTADNNVKEFELFVGSASPTGPFESIGRFKTQNVKLFKTPYQEFKFTPVKATYLKVKLLSTHGGSTHPNVPEVQLFGKF